MWRLLTIIPLCLGLTSAFAAEQRRIASDTIFCVNREDVLAYAIATNAKDSKSRDTAGCSTLKKGQRYTVLDAASTSGSIVKIRVHLPRRGTVEGYAVNPSE